MRDHKHTKPNIWVIIPCYNESATIVAVVKKIHAIVPNIVIVDDASSDQTPDLLGQLPTKVITNTHNLGYVQSIQSGLKYAFSHGADYAITFDADGQHLAADLRQFLVVTKQVEPDLILGKRSFKNRVVEKLFSLYTKNRLGLSDPFCGFKAYSKNFFKRISGKLEHHYTIGLESIFIELERSSPKIVEVKLTTAKRKDHPRFAGRLKGNLLELLAATNLIWYSRVSR